MKSCRLLEVRFFSAFEYMHIQYTDSLLTQALLLYVLELWKVLKLRPQLKYVIENDIPVFVIVNF